MRKIFIILSIFVFTLSANSQVKKDASKGKRTFIGKKNIIEKKDYSRNDIILLEDFEEGEMPNGWSEDIGEATQGWTFNTDASSDFFIIPEHTVYACINDDDCNCDMSDVWLMTDIIDLTNYSGVFLEFEYIAPVWTDDICAVKASNDGGQTWTTIINVEQTDYWEHQFLNLTNYAGESNFKLAFYYNDNTDSGDDYGFAIDDVVLYQPYEYDLSVISVSPHFVPLGKKVIPNVTLFNSSYLNANEWEITLTDGMSYNETIHSNETINPHSDLKVIFPEWNPEEGTYNLTAIVTLDGDELIENNSLEIECEVRLLHYNGDAYALNVSGNNYGTYDLENNVYSAIASVDTDELFPMAEEYTGHAIYRIYENSTIGIVLPETGQCVAINEIYNIPSSSAEPTGLAWDWEQNIMYITFAIYYPRITYFGTLDLNTFEFNEISSREDCKITAIDMAENGEIYGPSLNDDKLYKINPSTGDILAVGLTGYDINYGQDVSYDTENGILYTLASTHEKANFFGYYDLASGSLNMISSSSGQYGTFTIINEYVQTTYTVNFNINDDSTPIENAEISINGINTILTSNAEGNASIELPAGNYQFIVNHDDYDGEYNGNFTVSDNNMDINVNLAEISTTDFSKSDIIISPNPNEGIFKIEAVGDYTVNIFDITGRKIYSNTMKDKSEINITSEENGVYFVYIVNKKESYSYKLLKK